MDVILNCANLRKIINFSEPRVQFMLKLNKITCFIKKHLIDDVPNELAACELCRLPTCSNEKWKGCKNRLALKERLEKEEEKRGSSSIEN